MAKLLESSKYISVLGIISLLLASIAAFARGGFITVNAIIEIITSYGKDQKIAVTLIELFDTVLISVTLFIFAASLYELFIGKVNLPSWMLAENINDLKTKLSSMIILVMAGKFVEHLVEWEDPSGTMFFGISIAVVSGTLVAFNYFSRKGEE